jgi:large subunit ribosomal protein L14
LSFDDNAVVLLDSKSSIVGTRVFGPVPREVGIQGYNKILSAASFIV